jgi:hypothetical protein
VYSLFKIEFFNPIIFAFCAIIWILFPGLSWYSYLAIFVSIHQFVLLFNSIGHVIPIRYLFGCFMCLQFFIGPTLAYNGLDEYQFPLYKMQVPESQYFSYALPAVICFILGLHVNAGRLKGENIKIENIERYVERNKLIPYIFIAVGLFANAIVLFLPQSLTFVILAIAAFKFVGLFMLIIGSKQLKVLPLIVVFTSVVSASLGNAMFHDLLIWLIFTGAVFFIKFKPTITLKLVMCIVFITLAALIQQLKFTIRGNLREGRAEGVDAVTAAFYVQQREHGLLSKQSMAPNNVRINQGFIITYIMMNVPQRIPHANGAELWQIIEAAILPRFLAPNKLEAGDRTIFSTYSGIKLDEGTSMGLSSLGDGYINFGTVGGCVFMFVLGFFYSQILLAVGRFSTIYPILILMTPALFSFPIRPDNELQTGLGTVVKLSFLLFILFRFSKDFFKNSPPTEDEEYITPEKLQLER